MRRSSRHYFNEILWNYMFQQAFLGNYSWPPHRVSMVAGLVWLICASANGKSIFHRQVILGICDVTRDTT